ncbi:hypothetical protein J6590_028235 [Homalodisca vitripennis]|nr:hypothetical protein J6590_028235 [Homalodisca vitripennis]
MITLLNPERNQVFVNGMTSHRQVVSATHDDVIKPKEESGVCERHVVSATLLMMTLLNPKRNQVFVNGMTSHRHVVSATHDDVIKPKEESGVCKRYDISQTCSLSYS